MRQMNIHEEEADIAVWRLCRGYLCAHTEVAKFLRDLRSGKTSGDISANDTNVPT